MSGPTGDALTASRMATPRLPMLRLDATMTFEEPARLPPFRGHLWRGVLGAALKWVDDGVLPGFSTGTIPAGTLYRTLFESPPDPNVGRMRRYDATPHPYVIDAPPVAGYQDRQPGDQERFSLTLIGEAATAAEAVLAALDLAARAGLGQSTGADHARGRGRLTEVRHVWRADGPDEVVFESGSGFRPVVASAPLIPPCPETIRVALATPLRLVANGKVVTPRMFRPGMLVSNLVRRVASLMAFFGEGPLEADFRSLKVMWEGLSALAPMLAMADQTRWSASQEREIGAGGLIGGFRLDMRGREALFPYLWLGQWVHAGKGTVMGMGSIRIRPA